MKTLVNKNNPAIRITAPEITTGTGYYYVGSVGYYFKSHWTLVEEEQKPLEEWTEKDEKNLELISNCIYEHYPDPVIKYKLKDWLKSLPERFNLQPKQEWSEEDKHRCGDAIYFLETAKAHYADTSELERCIEWLKGLQPTEGIKENLEEIPSNVDLEKAAEDFVWEVMENDEDGISELSRKLRPSSKISDFYDALAEFFKAGAKWMENQFEYCGNFPIEDSRGGYWPTDYYIKKK